MSISTDTSLISLHTPQLDSTDFLDSFSLHTDSRDGLTSFSFNSGLTLKAKWPKGLCKLHAHFLKGTTLGEIYPAIVLPEVPTFLATHRRLLHRKGQVMGPSYRRPNGILCFLSEAQKYWTLLNQNRDIGSQLFTSYVTQILTP